MAAEAVALTAQKLRPRPAGGDRGREEGETVSTLTGEHQGVETTRQTGKYFWIGGGDGGRRFRGIFFQVLEPAAENHGRK